MRLRIYRTFKWEVYNPEKRLGGPIRYRLVPTDTLQFLATTTTAGGEVLDEHWVDVPIIEADKPIHPDR